MCTDFKSSPAYTAFFSLKCHLWQRHYNPFRRNMMLKWGNVFEKILHLRFWSIFWEDTTSEHLPLTGKPTEALHQLQKEPHHSCSNTSLGQEWAWRSRDEKPKGGGGGGAENKDGKKKAFKNGLVLISLPEENRGFRQARKNSHVEHCLVSKTVVQNTIKMNFLLPEKTSYLAIAKDTRCNDW